MTVLATQLYDSGYEVLFGDDNADNNTTGEFHWVLATAAYTPADTHTTTNDLTICADGDYGELAVTDVDFTKTPGDLWETYFQAGANASATTVSFGSSVTISAEYLILVRNVTAPTFSATTSKLIFYVDLNATNQGNLSSTNGAFTITMPTNGWFKVSQT